MDSNDFLAFFFEFMENEIMSFLGSSISTKVS